MKKIAFTGSRQGMNRKQFGDLTALLRAQPEPFSFHTGGAKGSDVTAMNVAHTAPRCAEIHVWLPKDATFVTLPYVVTVHSTGLTPLERNHLIIADADELYATPAQEHEIVRSGTWATVRYARKAHIWTWVISPDREVVG